MKSRKKAKFVPKPTATANAVQLANEEPKKETSMKRHHARWNQEEDDYLLANQSTPIRVKAGHLGRTMKAIRLRIDKLRVKGLLDAPAQPVVADTTNEEITTPKNVRTYRRRCKGQNYAYENKYMRIYSEKPFGWLKRLRYGVKAVA